MMDRINNVMEKWFWGAILAACAYGVYVFGREHTQALDRPIGQVSLNELAGSAGGSFLYGSVSLLLGLAALALFWRGLKNLWCDINECE